MPKTQVSKTLCVLLLALNYTALYAAPPLQTVDALDLQRYAGTWHQIALLPNRFQAHCVAETTAEYTLLPNAHIQVLNRCRRANGDYDEAIGLARQNTQYQRASILQVRFAPAWLAFLPWVWGDYWVLALEPDYSAVLIGAPNREYLWVLAREKTLAREVYERLKAVAAAQGFETRRLREEAGAVRAGIHD